jgi:dipeptidyl aminopeptidase/acylaminoacyl peptidase
MRRILAILLPLVLLAGCGSQEARQLSKKGAGSKVSQAVRKKSGPASGTVSGADGSERTLVEARRGFITRPAPRRQAGKPAPQPPPNVFRLVRYESPVGKLAAYLTPDPGDGAKHPAIIWITGGDCNSIDEVWENAPRNNDQTAAAYRNAGIIMMFPSLRGGNDNPGEHEGFFGEVDDVIAAAGYLALQPYVDPQRIYLGGHSTGGTLVMLVAESTDRFRAVFSFGPAHNLQGYSHEYLTFDTSNPKEFRLRAPVRWLSSVRTPLFVIEGTSQGNLASLQATARASTNPLIQFCPVLGATHFSVLAPANELIAEKILGDVGSTSGITISNQELAAHK